MTRADLLALAARVEAAAGADRRIDAEIAALFSSGNCVVASGPAGYFMSPNAAGGLRRLKAPAFTASLDAAASLVRAGWRLVALGCDGGRWHCVLANEQNYSVPGDAADEPRARIAAALRAMAEEAGDG